MKGIPRGIEFWLLKSGPDRWYWTCFLPSQRNPFKTRVEAETALADVVGKIINKKFKVVEHDMDMGAARDYMGGVPQLLRNHVSAVARKASPTNTSRPAKKSKTKPVSKRATGRDKSKKLSPVRGKSARSVSGSKRNR